MIAKVEEEARVAKRAAAFAREDLAEKPKDRGLRIAADDAEHRAREAGRNVVVWRFRWEIELWMDRSGRFEVDTDDIIVRLAPRYQGQPDWDFVAAAHLQRDGYPVPPSWRSPLTGEGLDHNYNHGSLAAVEPPRGAP